MKSRLPIAAFAVALSAITAGAVNAAPTGDACSMLTKEQVGAAIGEPVNEGIASGTMTCTWSVSKPTANGTKFTTLLVESSERFEAGKALASTKMKVTTVDGLGDSAYYVESAKYVALMVKKGSTAIKVAAYGDAPAEKKQAMEKTLAQEVLGKL